MAGGAASGRQDEANADGDYATHPWNINNLPRNRGSTLRYLAGNELITGVQVRCNGPQATAAAHRRSAPTPFGSGVLRTWVHAHRCQWQFWPDIPLSDIDTVACSAMCSVWLI